MDNIQFVRNFLREKNSYLNWGNAGIQKALSKKFNGKVFDLQVIKEAKKEVKKEYKNFLRKEKTSSLGKETKEDPNVYSELSKIVEKLGFNLISKEKVKKDEFKLPKTIFQTPEISDQVGMHILLGCNHVPFHNVQLHKSIIKLIKDYPELIKGFHLLGDFLDLNPLSSHDKGKFTAIKGLTLDDEYDAGNKLLDELEEFLPENCWKTYMYGNHEDRYNRWMSNMDNSKTPLTSPKIGLKLRSRGYQVKTRWSQDFITLGKDFQIFHGIYFNIHNAKKHLDTFGKSCAYVHTHRVQMYREGNLAAYNLGTCADLKSNVFGYATRAMKESWSNGFGINMIDEKGKSHITQIVPDSDGHFWYGGKYY